MKPGQVRCVNKTTNKVDVFARHLVENPLWRKHTGFEPAPLPEPMYQQPAPAVQANTEQPRNKGGRPRKVTNQPQT